MNVKQLIENIKKRPGMYILEFKIEYLDHFLNGFLHARIHDRKAEEIDLVFKEEFHEWVRRWIKDNKGIVFDIDMGYFYYIQQVCENQEQCITMFFELSEDFFDEYFLGVEKV
ncbi:MAG: hypothetical protein HFH23_15600 [Ruminococcus sp.]|nr:hypothetical protein [Ruminococcus sp.]